MRQNSIFQRVMHLLIQIEWLNNVSYLPSPAALFPLKLIHARLHTLIFQIHFIFFPRIESMNHGPVSLLDPGTQIWVVLRPRNRSSKSFFTIESVLIMSQWEDSKSLYSRIQDFSSEIINNRFEIITKRQNPK